jgi:ribosomal protein S18 acetylase RimI-like enzyme
MALVRVATRDDVPDVAAILAAGFSDDPVMAWVFDEPGRRAKLETLFGFSMTSRFLPAGRTYLMDDAAAGWIPPGSTPEAGAEGGDENEFVSRLFAAGATAEELGRLAVMAAAMDEAHPTEPHWYLAMIAARPERRAQGLGTVLMEHALETVDEQHMPAYLESSNPRNITLYERHGFVVTGTIELAGGPPLTPMWREPR